MASERQKRLARDIADNHLRATPLTAAAILQKAGYSVITSRKYSKQVIAGVGVQEELSRLGFNEETAKNVTAEILVNEAAADKDRLKAADIVFKVANSYQQEATIPTTVNYNLFYNPKFQEKIKDFEDNIKEIIRNDD